MHNKTKMFAILTAFSIILLLVTGAASAQTGCPADYPVDCGNGTCCAPATVCCSQQNASYTGCCSEEYPYCSMFNCYSSPPGPCALTYLAAGDPWTMKMMRNFRDTILMGSAAGRKYVALFYEHSPEVVVILAANAEIREQAEYLLANTMPDVLASLDNGTVGMSDEVVKDITALCDAVSAKARPELKKAIAMFKHDLASGAF